MIIRVARYDRTYNRAGQSEERDYFEVYIDGFKLYEGLELEEADAVSKAFQIRKERQI
jgi:hypothetical protein|tara:strand:- start:38 stop:211 length:174 start_codon:yes stop_codon:yes gene_type:complete